MKRYLLLILLIINTIVIKGQVNVDLSLIQDETEKVLHFSVENNSGSEIIILNETSPYDGKSYILCEITYSCGGMKHNSIKIMHFLDSAKTRTGTIADTRLTIPNNKKWEIKRSLQSLGLDYYAKSPDINLDVFMLLRYISSSGAQNVIKTQSFKIDPLNFQL
jgi:hypothetical protein